jgi:pseudouridine-5'-phosphate glycosidase
VLDGRLRIGLSDGDLERLADAGRGRKVSAADLAHVMVTGDTAGTTVSATLAACRLARPEPIRIMATGGVGGVHRGWTDRPDISADLGELARTACAVICSGAKAVLDVPATLEALEALGVAVVGYRTDRFPCFYSQGSDLPVPRRLDEVDLVARLCRLRWDELDLRGGVLLASPLPPGVALSHDELEAMIQEAQETATRRRVTGRDLTPFLLAELARRSGGRTVTANLALLEANAALAASLAVSLARLKTGGGP